MKFNLTKNQQEVFDRVEATSDNYLIQGKPGVGKSVLIRALIEEGRKTYTLAAPTGLAALNIGGRTLHSLFRLPVSGGIIDPSYNKFPTDDRVISNIKYNIKALIIDEVSMVRADMFDYIDRLMRMAKGKDAPFGGVQMILVGDFFQLPPVVTGVEAKQLRDVGYRSPFVFSSRAFQKSFRVLELSEVLRQKGDPAFIDLLDGARVGQVRVKHLQDLNDRVMKPNDIRINLTGTNKQADDINQTHLSEITEAGRVYSSETFGDWPAYPAEQELRLKPGAQVMVKMNAADRPPSLRGEFESKVVNGSLGKVKEMREDSVIIELDNGEEAIIWRKRWERKVKEKVGEDWTERIVASYTQIPLALAWAISIHKSQGQSFDKVHIDPQRIFAPGQLYVALSRCRSLEGLTLNSPVKSNKFWTDPYVLEFFTDKEE